MPYFATTRENAEAIAGADSSYTSWRSHWADNPDYFDPPLHPFATREEALAAKESGQVIAFMPSAEEWRTREHALDRESERWICPVASARYYHHAHLDPQKFEFLLYYASPEAKHVDRFTRIRVGRYLTEFYPHYTDADRRNILKECQRYAVSNYTITADSAEIAKIYNTAAGPDSCMRRKDRAEYNWQTKMDRGAPGFAHPCNAYGAPGDLALAYTGPIDSISQRAIVWPERKLYTRIYGTGPLNVLLERDGYTHTECMDGARLNAVKYKSSWLAPYVDGTSIGYLSADRKFIYLADNVDDSSVDVALDTTNGCDPYFAECATCGCEIPENSGRYCETCQPEECYSCDRVLDDDDPGVIRPMGGSHSWCAACAANYLRACRAPECHNRWHEPSHFDSSMRRERERNGLSNYCPACTPHYRSCECGRCYDSREHETCPATHCESATSPTALPSEVWFTERNRASQAYWFQSVDGSQWYLRSNCAATPDSFRASVWAHPRLNELLRSDYTLCNPPTLARPNAHCYARAQRMVPADWELQLLAPLDSDRPAKNSDVRRGDWIVCTVSPVDAHGHPIAGARGAHTADYATCEANRVILSRMYPDCIYRVTVATPDAVNTEVTANV